MIDEFLIFAGEFLEMHLIMIFFYLQMQELYGASGYFLEAENAKKELCVALFPFSYFKLSAHLPVWMIFQVLDYCFSLLCFLDKIIQKPDNRVMIKARKLLTCPKLLLWFKN